MFMPNDMTTVNNELQIVGKNSVLKLIPRISLGGINKNCEASQLMFMVRFTG